MVLVVRTPGDTRIADRLRAELEASGYSVVERTGTLQTALSQAARDADAVAALRVGRGALRVDLWIANPDTGATAFDMIVAAPRSRADDVPVRAVEILRARLIKLGVLRQSSRVEPEPEELPPVSEAPPAAPGPPEGSSPPAWWLGLAAAPTLSAGGLGAVVHARPSVHCELGPVWSVGMLALLPVTAQSVHDAEGSARVHVGIAALVADAMLARGHGWGYSLGVGGGLAWVEMQGAAESPYVGEQNTVLAGAGFTRIAGHRFLTSSLRLRAEILTGVAAPRPTIEFAGRAVASWGRPFASAMLGLDLGVPGT